MVEWEARVINDWPVRVVKWGRRQPISVVASPIHSSDAIIVEGRCLTKNIRRKLKRVYVSIEKTNIRGVIGARINNSKLWWWKMGKRWMVKKSF